MPALRKAGGPRQRFCSSGGRALRLARRTGRWMLAVVGARVVADGILLAATNPSRTGWIQWRVQQLTTGSATGSGSGAPYSWVYQTAPANPYGEEP